MYFRDRMQAGEMLAAELGRYVFEPTVILTLSAGGTLVGAPIAKQLKASMSLLLTEPIKLPGVVEQVVGLIDQRGHFTYDEFIAAGHLEEYLIEMRSVIEEEKMQKLYKMARVLQGDDIVEPKMFRDKHVIIISDGLKSGVSFDAAVNFLKPIKTGRIIAAVPLVSVSAVDRLHTLCDEIHVLSVVANYLDTDHYYEDNSRTDAQMVLKAINQLVQQDVDAS
jgi:putative phosphoribosyl transferase